VKSLAIDLRSRRTPSRLAWWALGVLAVVALGAVVALMNRQRELRSLEAVRQSLRQQLAEPPRKAPVPPAPVRPYDASARVAVALARAEWAPLLTALESMEVPGVTPIGIEISAMERQVRVELEFADFAAVLRFIDELNAGESVSRWQLTQAQGTARSMGGLASSGGAPTATIRAGW